MLLRGSRISLGFHGNFDPRKHTVSVLFLLVDFVVHIPDADSREFERDLSTRSDEQVDFGILDVMVEGGYLGGGQDPATPTI